MAKAGRQAFFFDLGGTLLRVEDDEIWRDQTGRVESLPGVEEKLKSLRGEPVFVVTNRSGIEKDLLTPHDVAGFIAQINAKCQSVLG